MGILSYTFGNFLELLQYHKLWASSNRFQSHVPHITHSLIYMHIHVHVSIRKNILPVFYPCTVEYYCLHLREDQKFQVSGKDVLRKSIG
jgi:hypothetical protein